VRVWLPEALAAATALAPLAESLGVDVERATARVRAYAGAMLDEAGLPELCGLVDHTPEQHTVADPQRAPARVRSRPDGPASRSDGRGHPASSPTAAGGGSFDYVGIVMAKSAEGDAVAAFMGRRDGVEVREQPAFWDIRARDRLVIPYRAVSEEVGYELDAYSIQHEMSTHYGRMVATDDALMLFSDPTEAMEHLLS
jgi:propane monooxygenase coupling protein